MKKLLYSMALPVAVCFGFTLISCSDDDNKNGSSPDLPYESASAKYEMTSGSPYRSVEFTASGNYIPITDQAGIDDYESYSVPRAESDGVYAGTYTMSGDNHYNLKDFGTIVVESSGSNSVLMTITTSSGSETHSALKTQVPNLSDFSKSLCRLWKTKSVRMEIWSGGKKVYDKTAPANNVSGLQYVEQAAVPYKVEISEFGTYARYNENMEADIAYWRWVDEKEGLVGYRWSGTWDDAGVMTVSLKGSDLVVSEEYEEEEDGVAAKVTFTFSPSK